MKNIIISISVFFHLMTLNIYSQAGWFFQNPNPTGNLLNSVHFANQTTGYAVGMYGTVIKTIDGGNSWSLLNSGYSGGYDFLSSVYFTSPGTGYITGGGGGLGTGLILKTINGGLTWIKINQGYDYPVNGIFFVNELTGFAAGSFGRIFKTTNAGNNWSVQTITSSNLGPIFFVNTLAGYTGGNDSSFYKTTNSGVNWMRITSPGRNYNGDIYFINENTGFCCPNIDGLKKTTNGGASWFNSENTRVWTSVYFINANTGFISGDFGEMKKTTNCGQNWISLSNQNLNQSLREIFFADSLFGIGVGYEGLIRKSTNGGLNWTTVNNNVRDSLYDISFLGDIGYTSGGNGTILKSNNAGLTWVSQSKITSATIYSLSLFSQDIVLGVGSGRKIIRTTNGGTNWISITPGNYSSHLYSISKISSISAIAVGDFGLIMKSTNSGANWTNITSPVTTKLTSVSFGDSLNGAAVGENGLIIKTSNSGDNWTQVTTDHNFNNLNGISFANANTGLAVGLGGTIIKTTNAGVSWVQKTSGTIEELVSVSTSNPACYVTSTPGYVFKSTDLGESWQLLNVQTNAALLSVHFNDANTGWICGTGGAILKTTTGGVIFVNQISTEVPSSFCLNQNYPNPFNPYTKIKFEIPSSGRRNEINVQLIIYDMLGREVTTLLNRQLQPGTYEADFDGSSYASGIYYYRLTIDAPGLLSTDYSKTMKMVLIK